MFLLDGRCCDFRFLFEIFAPDTLAGICARDLGLIAFAVIF
jgi:hypothetical protein